MPVYAHFAVMRYNMRRKSKVNIALTLALLLLCAMLSGSVSPEDGASTDFDTVDLYLDGILTDRCPVADGVPYMSSTAFASLITEEYEEDLVSAVPLELSEDEEYVSINGRYYYLEHPVIQYLGTTFYPLETLCEIFSCTLQTGDSGAVNIDAGGVCLPVSGDEYYDETDLYWLSRIIFAESGNQCLDGMLGVGNVVLNRVESGAFPDSVYEVIFDSRYGIQFSPVETGSIYREPSDGAVIAAKLCLEGCSVAGESLYFVNPKLGLSAWFKSTRTYLVSIGDHDFYA